MTAETAVILPALVLVIAAGLWAMTVVAAQLTCVDAARAGARAAARGEPVQSVRTEVLRAAPPHAKTSITKEKDLTKVVVSAAVHGNWGPALPSITVTATAFSATEPDLGQSAGASSDGAAVGVPDGSQPGDDDDRRTG